MLKRINLKVIVPVLIFVGLYTSYMVPVYPAQRFVMKGSLILVLVAMFFIIKDPNEKKNAILNWLVAILTLVMLVLAIIK